MIRQTFIVILLMTYALPLVAQELSPTELIALGKGKMASIDSIMMAKGFNNKKANKLPGSTITAYAYSTRNDTGVILRSLQVGWRSSARELNLEYGVWQKTDADNFISQLLQMGFKKTVRSIHGIVAGETMEMISYKRGVTNVSYMEQEEDARSIRYAFIITVNRQNF